MILIEVEFWYFVLVTIVLIVLIDTVVVPPICVVVVVSICIVILALICIVVMVLICIVILIITSSMGRGVSSTPASVTMMISISSSSSSYVKSVIAVRIVS